MINILARFFASEFLCSVVPKNKTLDEYRQNINYYTDNFIISSTENKFYIGILDKFFKYSGQFSYKDTIIFTQQLCPQKTWSRFSLQQKHDLFKKYLIESVNGFQTYVLSKSIEYITKVKLKNKTEIVKIQNETIKYFISILEKKKEELDTKFLLAERGRSMEEIRNVSVENKIITDLKNTIEKLMMQVEDLKQKNNELMLDRKPITRSEEFFSEESFDESDIKNTEYSSEKTKQSEEDKFISEDEVEKYNSQKIKRYSPSDIFGDDLPKSSNLVEKENLLKYKDKESVKPNNNRDNKSKVEIKYLSKTENPAKFKTETEPKSVKSKIETPNNIFENNESVKPNNIFENNESVKPNNIFENNESVKPNNIFENNESVKPNNIFGNNKTEKENSPKFEIENPTKIEEVDSDDEKKNDFDFYRLD